MQDHQILLNYIIMCLLYDEGVFGFGWLLIGFQEEGLLLETGKSCCTDKFILQLARHDLSFNE